MRDVVLTLLDALSFIVVAAGAGTVVAGAFLLWWHLAGPVVVAGGLGTLAGGLVLALASWLASRGTQPSGVDTS